MLTMLLTLVFCLGLFPMSTFAGEGAVATQDELKAAIQNASGATTIELGAGTFNLPNDGSLNGKEITFKGGKDTVFDIPVAVQPHDASLTFEGITAKFPEDGQYIGLQHTKKVAYKDCVLKGTQFMYPEVAEFTNCTFENQKGYCVWTYGSKDVTFTNCTFNTGGRAILVYNEGELHADIKVDSCTFKDDGTYTSKPKAAVEVGKSPQSADTTYKLTIKNCKTEGFEENKSDSPLWGNKDSMDAEHLTGTVDGVSIECAVRGDEHKAKVVPAVAPTATKTGLTEGKVCEVCGKVLVAQEVVPATGEATSDKPADKTNADSPKTGDDSNMVIWVVMLMTAVCGLGGCVVAKRR